jgi:signal transduction histidine kinase
MKQLLDHMGGKINAESEVGSGLTFCVRIPIVSLKPQQTD